ncbi:MAG: lipopolysaccharide biosynthesis protein [Chitinivibrionia bacterium]|nr:lipopolysaccharide biosynthesis protein [Chitinivibrionia bacterium]
MSNSENNKRIAKNTLALYFRQIITMVVALFTSRIVLQTLGVTDYGINNVVGGVVAMFGFLSNTLMVITQRFISVELGKGGNLDVLQKIFSTSMILHIVACVIVVILAETIGLWFLNNKLVIPAERIVAANWVYQFAVFGFVLSLLNAPLTALIISHEDMHIYGYMGIFDVVIRLLTVYLLVIINADKLIFLALFGFAVTCVVWLFYFIYCRKKYRYARFSFVYDKSMSKEISGYGGYMFIASVLMVFNIYGINIMLNMFFGPAINAARGIATSVNTALMSFGNNFKQALNPQLMKSYAQNDPEYMWNLVERGTRMLYFLFFIFSVPLLLETDFILKLWLGKVPEYTAIFTKLIIIVLLTEGLSSNLTTINHATGNIKAYCILVYYTRSVITLLLSYFVCKAGYKPQYVLAIPLFMFPIFMVLHYIILKKQVNFSIRFFAKKALVPIFFVSAVSFFPFYFVDKLFYESFFRSCVVIIISMLWTGIVIMFIGLKKNERIKIVAFVKRKIGLAV